MTMSALPTVLAHHMPGLDAGGGSSSSQVIAVEVHKGDYSEALVLELPHDSVRVFWTHYAYAAYREFPVPPGTGERLDERKDIESLLIQLTALACEDAAVMVVRLQGNRMYVVPRHHAPVFQVLEMRR